MTTPAPTQGPLSSVPTGHLWTMDPHATPVQMFKVLARVGGLGNGAQTLTCQAYGPAGLTGEPFTVSGPAQLATPVTYAPDPAGPAADITYPPATLPTAEAAVQATFPEAAPITPEVPVGNGALSRLIASQLQFFGPEFFPITADDRVINRFCEWAHELASFAPSGPEAVKGMDHLLAASHAFVRAGLAK